jgi:hypothetical protein
MFPDSDDGRYHGSFKIRDVAMVQAGGEADARDRRNARRTIN